MKKAWCVLLLALTTTLLLLTTLATPLGVKSAALATSTRWPTVTLRPTDTRWPVRPTSTRWPTSTRRGADSTMPTFTPTATSTPLPFFEGPVVIGYSVQNRPLEVYRFGTGPIERMIVAGMHGGNEYNTIKLADQLIEHIKTHPEVIPADVTLYILRSLNPDGVARGLNIYGRTNANNVDLNRNWDANWQADWPRTGCWSALYTSGGTGPASEPETKALAAFILAHHIDALINYHSAYLGIFAGGVPDYPPSFALADAVAEVTTYPWPPIDTGCVLTGGMVDWTAAQGIASLDIELSNPSNTDFTMSLSVLNVLVTWRR